ncbi:Oidioi.mRNA.OKI2018_I69.chr2.g8376.t1.cds [Oikopleura dioica]|uniref:Oidioi.mRNA.OKI2018_I69.chr2.g8376.t1.cds n=1 Tax=Oikopleura dioica TaxID=34765 RepID=A0ABN7TC59_OIKDI|nr:Oidioi.mRNA.OKI2018_I69.chr2.g8376.t1.cds [Oikopleura dioica]
MQFFIQDVNYEHKWIRSAPAIGLSSGALLTIGGYDYDKYGRLDEIWKLYNDVWSLVGYLAQAVDTSSVLLVEDSSYVFPRYGDQGLQIQRINLDSDEQILSTDLLGDQRAKVYYPILFVTYVDFCSSGN